MVDRTQQAAQRCADLANADEGEVSGEYTASDFIGSCVGTKQAFRRYVETEDALKREVLAILRTLDGDGEQDEVRLLTACRLLRDNLLPDPQPTLYEQFVAEKPLLRSVSPDFSSGARHALDWIANRGEPTP